jgi:hypothetical protein
LVQFLTVTKAGYCEQFAGAFGVLARTLGIPTRLVVGFTPGRAGPGHTFTVTGADAHVWPQVYLGPQTGWVSVEPTPSIPAAVGVLGVGGVSPSAAERTTPSTVVRRATAVPPRHHTHAVVRHHGVQWWIPGVVLLGLLALTPVVMLVIRRRRSIRDSRLPPDQGVVRSWDIALGALRRRGLGRRADETPGEYVARVRASDRDAAGSIEDDTQAEAEAEAAALEDLAALVELACYTPGPCTPGQAADAHALASTIVVANRRHLRRRRRRGAGVIHGDRAPG